MGQAYKRGDVWYIDFRANGRRIRKRVGRSKQVAELALKDAEVKVARKEFGFYQSDISVQQFIEKFRDAHLTL